ncbi:MAG: ABC transporter ATP-binding protein [Acidobacteria bacterium]|nr:ABC transporter ATP-binding protein [Acidobacteriota bacterium]
MKPAAFELPQFAELRAPKLRVAGVSRKFDTPNGSSVTALEHISFEVRPGELLCIVGPSGCGKSTLLSLMAGLDKPSAGEIFLDGHRVDGPGTGLSVIFQELGLFPWLTVLQNVEFGLKMKGMERAERRKRAMEFLRLVHLSAFESSYIHQLSGGMKQRVALARSLATAPDVLFMDEPFAALDAQTRDLMHEELERVWKETGQTIVFVTHNVREAARLGDRIMLLTFRPGRVKSVFPVILERPRHLEDADLAMTAREVLAQLKEEINKAVEEEYRHAAKD